MIELRGVSRSYKLKKQPPVKALVNINLILEETGMVFIHGKSGSGKSTLLNIIGGLDKYDEGDLLIQGKSTSSFKQADYDNYRNTMVGFIFQDYNVLDEFTVAQNIALSLQLQGKKIDNQTINNILEKVDLVGLGKRKPNQLSGGQKQRVAIARALVKDPKIIMADEPTGALDSNTGRQVLETLAELAKTRLVIIVSHDESFARTYGDRIIEFKDGEIISDVSRESSLRNDNLSVSQKGITLKQGYELTETDLALINDYLGNKKNLKSLQNELELGSFTKTRQAELNATNKDYKLIKSKLPFIRSFKLGVSALKHKRIRLGISILLAGVSFSLFAVAHSLTTYNEINTSIKTLQESGINYINFSKASVEDRGDYTIIEGERFTKTDLELFNDAYDELNFTPTYSINGGYRYNFSNILYNSKNLGHSPYYHPNLYDVDLMELNQQIIDDYNLKLVHGTNKVSRLPLDENEIVITSYLYDVIANRGLTDDKGRELIIKNVDDIIDHELVSDGKIYKHKIVGIVDTNLSKEYDGLKLDSQTSDFGSYIQISHFQQALQYGMHLKFFIAPKEANRLDNYNLYNVNEFNMNINVHKKDSININYYFNNFGTFSQLNEGLYVPFGDDSSLTSNDIVLDFSTFLQYINIESEIDDELRNINNKLVKKLAVTLEESSELELVNAFNAFFPNGHSQLSPLPSKEEYVNLLFDTYRNYLFDGSGSNTTIYHSQPYALSHQQGVTYPLFAPVLDKAREELALINSPQKISVDIFAYDYDDKTTLTNEFNIKGITLAGETLDKYSNNVIYLDNNFLKQAGFDTDSKYESIISSNVNLTTKQLRKILEANREFKKAKNGIVYQLNNERMQDLDAVTSTINGVKTVTFYVGIGLSIFAGLLLVNYISVSVSYKKKEIGILRALGARGKDVVKIFFNEAIVIGLFAAIVGSITAIVIVFFLNREIIATIGLLVNIFNFGLLQFGLIGLISLLFSLIASFVPVQKIASKRPIDAIRNK